MGDFLQFDSDKANIMDDANYLLSTYRTGGCVSGVAPSNTHNKLFYQLSTFAAAFAGAMKAKGYTMSDAILADLQTELSEVVTELDMVHSLLTNGYQKLPKGPDGLQLIIQWGQGIATASGRAMYTLPITFPTAFLLGFCSDITTVDAHIDCAVGHLSTTSQIQLYSGQATNTINYLCLGY